MHHESVFVIDDDPSVRDALSLLLSLHGYASATFASAEDFIAAVRPDWRGCVVADIRMPGMSGLDLQALLRERGLALPFVVMTAHGDVAAARRAFLADAVDFLVKPFDSEQLLAAVQTAMAGVRAVAAARKPSRPGAPAAPPLSPREAEVMSLLVQGMHNRRIAAELGISPRTVEVHKARVLEKLGASSVVELVRLIERRGD